MEIRNESNDSRWVDERLATLSDYGEWRPSPKAGLAMLKEACEGHRRSRLRRGLTLAVIGAGSLSVAAFPVTRAFASRCLSACVEETSRLFGPGQTHSVPAKLETGATAPDFTLNDSAGQPVRLSSFRGKPVLLNFWATWCPPCKIEIPWFMEFQRRYGESGLVVLGVSVDDDGWKSVKPFIDSKGLNYRIVLGNDGVTRLYGGLDALPATLLIDRQGRIVSMHSGLAGKDVYEDEIKALLTAN